MKLKKIASLALAGVMAVSMLAGCKYGTPGSSSSSSSSEQTATTGIAAAMNAVQKYVEVKDSNSNDLANAVKKATYAQLDAATFGTTVGYCATTDAVAEELDDNILSNDMNLQVGIYVPATFTNTAKGSKQTYTYLFLVDDIVSEEVAATAVAKTLFGTASYYPVAAGTTGDMYAATYTGEVSIAKASKANEVGDKTASAYYIMVSVTRTLGDVVVANS